MLHAVMLCLQDLTLDLWKAIEDNMKTPTQNRRWRDLEMKLKECRLTIFELEVSKCQRASEVKAG